MYHPSNQKLVTQSVSSAPRRRFLSSALIACGFALLFSSCDLVEKTIGDAIGGKEPTVSGEIIYVQNNVPVAGQNAILAYVRGNDGKLTQLSGSPFLTKGKGVGNPEQILGPNDSDNPIIISADRKYLFATNSGSNTIAVFKIYQDGSLVHVPGSPFPSGGINPVSVGLYDSKLYVVNKNQDPAQPNDGKPNYTVFKIEGSGALTPIPESTVEVVKGGSPSFAYVPGGKSLLFGADFLAFQAEPPVGTLRAFSIKSDGTLKNAPGSPQAIPGMGGALGLEAHPFENILYVGFPMQAKVGVYRYNTSSGELTFKRTTDAGAAACWIRVNRKGNRFYTLNTAENTVSVHDATDAESPVEIQKFEMKLSGPLFDAGGGMMFTSSQPFYEELSLDEKYLYVVNQHANPDFSSNYNYFHVLKIDAEGKLSEPGEPMQLPVSASTRPQGVAVY